jgi:hypothetical protein
MVITHPLKIFRIKLSNGILLEVGRPDPIGRIVEHIRYCPHTRRVEVVSSFINDTWGIPQTITRVRRYDV